MNVKGFKGEDTETHDPKSSISVCEVFSLSYVTTLVIWAGGQV